MSYLIINKNLNSISNNTIATISSFKTFNNTCVVNSFSKFKFNYRDYIFYFQQMNRILYKPFNRYCYNFFLSFKTRSFTVEDKEYAHQFCFFSNFKLKNTLTFYILDKSDYSFFSNYEENTIYNFFVPCKGDKVDWILFKYFWGQTKKHPSYYIEFNYPAVDNLEINKILFFSNFCRFKIFKSLFRLSFKGNISIKKKNYNKLFIIKKYYNKYIKNKFFYSKKKKK